MSVTINTPYGTASIQTQQAAPPPHLLRFFGTGMTNSGKSHLAASIGPRCLVIDFEDKHRLIDFPGRSAYYVPSSLVDLDAEMVKLFNAAKDPKRPYDMVVFDTADEMIPFLIDGMSEMIRTAKPGSIPGYGDVTDFGSGGGKGSRGWKMVNDRFAAYMRRLTRAGYGWGFISHLKSESVEVTRMGKKVVETREVPMLNAGILRPIQSLSLVKFQTFTREVNKPTMIDRPDGKGGTVKVAGPSAMFTEHMLTFDEKERGAIGLGGNIPLSGTYILPKTTGWNDVVVAQYLKGLAGRAQTVEK